ncbi:MAG: tetratricopeptide repeat protein [Bacteroidia bacterium]
MRKKEISLVRIIVFCCFLSFVTSCTTKKNTAMHRGWHNMNARYNGYFYSREYLKESIKKVEKANKDDFTKLLPLFVYTTNDNAKDYYGDFDKTIKKSSTVIQRHAIINPKTKEEIPNACRWIDENYMLIGQSHFYKREFFTALEMFEYVSKKYPNPEAKYGAMLWMIRANNELGSFSRSESVMDDIRSAEDFPVNDKLFMRDLAAVTADYYIKREEHAKAIPQLTKAIALTKKKMIKARYLYVLAQLYAKIGNDKEAANYFAMVPGLHPAYDMEFSARINHARLYDAETGNTKAVKKQLSKMLSDAKNIEYRDQIYYALAEIAYKEKDIPLAIKYLDNSIKESTTNNTQKALSYLRRADIYFERMNYKAAEANYDSTMTFLPKDYVDYELISSRKKSLTALVQNLNVIAMEDSLQRMAKLTDKQREEAIDKIIKGIEEEEERKKEEALLQKQEPLVQNQTTTTTTTSPALAGGNNSWYFYNPATVSFGVGEFNKKWGARKLEDNWRRSEKAQDMVAATEEEEEEGVDSTAGGDKTALVDKGPVNKKDKNYYLKKIPLTPDALAKSNAKIIDAYYNAGTIYKEQLLNTNKSNETFEELLTRYPDNKYKQSIYYHLYRTYLSMNNAEKSDYYKNILLRDFPDSEYAKIIKNPSYAKDIMASRNQVEKFYAETYQLYSEGKYSQALANCILADTSYSKSPLMPQFAFVKALCIGRTQDINAFENALTQVVIKYPKEPVKERAQEMLDLIRKQKTPEVVSDTTKAAIVAVDTTKAKPKFIFKEDGDYYWVTIVQNGKGDITKFKTALSNINAESFSTGDLTISSVFLDITNQLVSVKSFDGKEEAMQYYDFFKDNTAAFKDLLPGSYQSFIISSENYITFYKDKNIQEYQQFFTQNFK